MSETKTPDELVREVRERLQRATPGPWRRSPMSGRIWAGNTSITCEDFISEEDGRLIAHAPSDLAALCDAVERLQSERAADPIEAVKGRIRLRQQGAKTAIDGLMSLPDVKAIDADAWAQLELDAGLMQNIYAPTLEQLAVLALVAIRKALAVDPEAMPLATVEADQLDKLQRIVWKRGSMALARTEGGGVLMIDYDGEPMAQGRSLVEAIEKAPEPVERKRDV